MEIVSNLVEVHLFRIMDGNIYFLLLKRANTEIYPGLWQMVTGRQEPGEKAFDTALREVKEETGLVPLKLWIAPNVNHFYSHEDDSINLIPVFAVLVEDEKVIICEEHCEWGWFPPHEAKKLLAWAGQRKSVDIITEYFTKESSFLNFIEVPISQSGS